MNRRELFLAAASLTASAASLTHIVNYGCVTAEQARIWRDSGVYLRVYLDGEDITDRCYEADDVANYAKVFRLRDGEIYWDYEAGDIAKEVLRGEVRFERRRAGEKQG
jgi:hypothetical protein